MEKLVNKSGETVRIVRQLFLDKDEDKPVEPPHYQVEFLDGPLEGCRAPMPGDEISTKEES